jgi:hypothetical protein
MAYVVICQNLAKTLSEYPEGSKVDKSHWNLNGPFDYRNIAIEKAHEMSRDCGYQHFVVHVEKW